MPADLIIYALVAVALVFWLRNTLGTEEGGADEPLKNARPVLPDLDDISAGANSLDVKSAQDTEDPIEVIKNDKSGVIAIDSLTAERGLNDILAADKNFDLNFFFSASQDVFVMVVEAFADGDREALDSLLGDDVYRAFSEAINAREDLDQRAQSEVTAIREAHIIDAQIVNGSTTQIVVRFVADQTYALYDAEDTLLEGHAERSFEMRDIWVFSRDINARDPRWFVEETRGGFEGDNDIIPNS